jgi:prepilin-type N-terminal cleavage/methylation domain-containing protein
MMPRGFTLVEMAVTVAIVVFLSGLALTAGATLSRRAEVQHTRHTLMHLDAAVEAWELAAERKLSRGFDEDRDDVWQFRAYTLIITEILDVVQRVPEAKEAIARIDPELIYRYTDDEVPAWITGDATGHGGAGSQLPRFVKRKGFTVLDAWGVPIYATHPGQLATHPTNRDPDGTINTYNEKYFGAARNRRVCFVSAGPDGLFGDLHFEKEIDQLTAQDWAEIRQAEDNVYSYPIAHRGTSE